MVKNVFKILIASGLIAYLVQNGKLDFGVILKALNNPIIYFLGFFMIIIQCTLNALRWRLILTTQTTEKIPSFFVIMVCWVGMFFNTVLPGAVSGDLVKMIYLKKIDEKLTKTSMFLTVLMDRIYGLIALILITGIVSIFRYNYLSNLNEDINKIITVNLLLLVGVFLFISTLFVSNNLQEKLILLIKRTPKLGEQIAHLLDCFWSIGKNKAVFVKSIFFSLTGQFFGLSAFFVLASPLIVGDINILDIYTFAPIGFIITAIPLAPGGMGVGHVAFDQLFQYLSIANGADLFNMFWVTMMIINLMGIVPYLVLGKAKKKIISPKRVKCS